MALKTKSIKLGRRVQYVDSNGFKKLGLINGTADTIQGGDANVPAITDEDRAHIKVLSPSGKDYQRHNIVRSSDGEPNTFEIL